MDNYLYLILGIIIGAFLGWGLHDLFSLPHYRQ